MSCAKLSKIIIKLYEVLTLAKHLFVFNIVVSLNIVILLEIYKCIIGLSIKISILILFNGQVFLLNLLEATRVAKQVVLHLNVHILFTLDINTIG